MTSTSTGDGIPLLTRVLLIRATARFDPSFPGDAHRATAAPRSLHPGRTATSAAARVPVHVNPSLRIAAHYAQGSSPSTAGNNSLSTNPSTLRSATTTPKEEAEFFASHAALHELLLSLAADRLDEKVRLRQVQTDIARTTVKLARASANTQGGVGSGVVGGGGGGGRTTSSVAASAGASPDAASFFSASPTSGTGGSSPVHRSGPLGSTTSMDEDTSHSGTASTTTQQQQQQRVQGMLAAATATFAEDAAWRSLVTPYRPQLNPWSATPVADEGCYLSFPSPAYTHWCEQQAARCCAGSGLDANSTEPDVQCGPMRYNDVVHYASVNGVGKSAAGSGVSRGGRNAGNTSSCPVEDEAGYLHGYVLLLDGAVFAGAGDQKDGSAADDGPFSEDDGEVSVLLWCVLSDAPVFNFMRALALEVAAGMSYVAQRTYHTTASTHTTTKLTSTGAGVSTDVYASLLDATLDEEVVRPLAAELTTYGSGASRTLPGDTFTVNMRIRRSNQTGVAARPQTSSLSSSLTFRRPLDLLFPSADVPLSVLLLSFGEDALRVLQSLLLQEERVVVVGATPQHASACVVSLVSLIAPFTWVSPLVPYLPPHTAAQTGFLHTLLSSPYELQQQQSQQSQPPYTSPVSPRPAPYSAGVASQSSQQLESGGFLVGSTAAIRPYLMFLSAFGVAEDMGGKGRSGRTPRVWLADARTGAVGVCPTEPISLYLRTDATAAGDGDSDSAPLADGSCGALGGASPWTQAAHLDLRLAAPQMYAPRPTTNSSLTNGSMSSSTGAGASGSRGSRTAHNPYVLYNTVRNTLRTAAELNVMDATPLDVLPPFHDELRDALRKAAPAEKRRQFRQALEEQTQHAQVRLDNLASLAARLVRGLREALRASALASGGTRQASFSVNSEDEDDSGGGSSYSSGSSSDSDGDDDDNDEANESGKLRMDDNASFRAVTAAVAQSQSVSFADPALSNLLAQFPVLSAAEVWQVQTTFFAYVVGRLTGGYRRGITLVGGASHRGTGTGKRRYMEASVFLAPGLEQHYTLAETVARTHLFRQFECAVLAMETIGLRQVLSGCGLRVGRGVHETGERAGEAHAVLKYVRPLVQLALLCDRARLQFPELYGDHPDLDAVRSVYAAVVKRCFSNGPGTQRVATLPPIIGVLAGYNGNNTGSNAGGGGGGGSSGSSPTSADPNHASVLSGGSSGGTYSTRSGGGFRGFLSKAMKAMKLNSGGSSSSGSGSGAGSGGGRGLPVLYLPASVACMNSFSVVPFSEQHVAPQSFDITTYDAVGPDGKRRHQSRGGYPQRHGGKKKKADKGNRRRHRRQRIAEMYAIPVKPQRQQWARQQQHQQLTAMNIDFTLDDCTSVVRNHHVVGGVTGSLTSSFAASSLAAGAGVSNGSIFVSGGGLDAEVLGALARAGGSRRSGSHDAALRVMAETSLSVCHALPLDVVHQFDAYEPLLAPVLPAAIIAGSFASSTTTNNTTSGPVTVLGNGSLKAATADEDVASPAAYMAVGLLCPSCVNVWREGEARATRVLLEQRQQRQQQQLQQSSRRRMSASPPLHAHTNSSLLPPKPPRLMGASTPLEAQSWSTPAASLSAHQQQQQQHHQQLLHASSAASGLPPPSSWCTFSSGAPLGYPIDDTPRSYMANNATLASSAEFSTTLTSNAAPLLSAAASPTPQMPQARAQRHHQQQPHHQDEWDSWGVQAPVVVNTPNTATAPTRGTATTATTTATSIESTSSPSSAVGSPSGMTPLTLGSVALPLAAPAPGDVMDELFAGLSNYKANSGTSASVSSVTAAGSPQGKMRQQTLDDFF